MNQIIAFKLYVAHDVITSNLVLIVLKLYRFSVQTFLNARKSLDGHAKHFVTLQLLMSIKLCLVCEL